MGQDPGIVAAGGEVVLSGCCSRSAVFVSACVPLHLCTRGSGMFM